MENSDAILKWLRDKGFPSELQVGHVLREGGWSVSHARWYLDPETQKPRELDIHATISQAGNEPRGFASVALAVECKSSEKAWVAFSANRKPPPEIIRHAIVAVDPCSTDALLVADVRRVARPALFDPASDIGHGIVKAHSDNRSGDPTSPYSALRSVVNATLALGQETEGFVAEVKASASVAQVTVPLLVLDGILYQYSLQDDATESLVTIDWTSVALSMPNSSRTVAIHVVTKPHLATWLRDKTPGVVQWCTEMLPHLMDVQIMTRSRLRAAGVEA